MPTNQNSRNRGCQIVRGTVCSKKRPWTRIRIRILRIFRPENSNIQNSNMQNLMMVFTFSVFHEKYPFSVNLVQKIKIISLSWNLVPILIWICKIQWWCSLFPFSTRNTFFFWGGGGFRLNLSVWTEIWYVDDDTYYLLVPIRKCTIHWWCSLFQFKTGNVIFGQIWSKISKLSV